MTDVEKAIAAAEIFVKHKHKGCDRWTVKLFVEMSTIIGENSASEMTARMVGRTPDPRTKMNYGCTVSSEFGSVSYNAGEAWAIAQYLESKS